jgi:hypothetical protein
MINRVTGQIDFRDGLRIAPHCALDSLFMAREAPVKVQTRKLPLGDWKRHILGPHPSEHGIFEVEALSADDDCIHVVLLSHQHPFYEPSEGPFTKGWSTQISAAKGSSRFDRPKPSSKPLPNMHEQHTTIHTTRS